ncbi:MAG: DUF4136 domain-containing protein [Burkholderiales bacterium]|nr:DUF4136 domain-containing protein [Burkholderiales bacterium]
MIRSIACAAALVALAGCASLDSLDANVSSFSRWPAGRAPATYAFERLPSQQANPQASQVLEDSARLAVEAAGFVPAGEGTEPDVSVQIGARVTATDRSPFDDPFWYGPGGYGPYRAFGYGRYGRPYWGPGWRHAGWGYGWGPGYYDMPYYEREVAVLIRDKKSGEPLYEARVNSDGTTSGVTALLPAMFSAALIDFPKGAASNPHRVRVPTTTTTQ